VSAFAGCGGSSLGYKWAGGRGLCAIEFDANAAATYRLNFPDTPIIEQDIREVMAQDVMETAGLRIGELDVLDGSPPCQGFSTAGKRKMTDPRNNLFAEFVRLIEDLRPKAFVMENVSGLVKGKMRLLFREMMLALKATSYRVRCKLLDAKYFHVPQSRERLIWIGVRKDLEKEPDFPKPEAKPIGLRDIVPYVESSIANVGFRSVWRSGDKPTATICASGPGKQSGIIRVREASGVRERAMTIGECKAACGFPNDFRLTGTFAQRWACLGNSVLPPLMQAIAERVRDTLLQETTQGTAVT